MQSAPAPFDFWMLAEIYEQPATLQATLDRYIADGQFRAEPADAIRSWLEQHQQFVIAASGSSRHAGLAGEAWIEKTSGAPVDVEYSSEYLYRTGCGLREEGLIVVSQSGESGDTLSVLRKAGQSGMQSLAVTNVPDSSMAREATISVPTVAGVERAVPATKSFSSQLVIMQLLALLAADARMAISPLELRAQLRALCLLPQTIAGQLDAWKHQAERVATQFLDSHAFLFLGRGTHFPIAREGALKLKESAYVQAEAYPGGELKHGPNALVAKGTPLVMLATVDHADPSSAAHYARTLQLMRDMRAQQAEIIAIANTGDSDIAALADAVIEVEQASDALLAICEVIPLQMFAYFFAVMHGVNMDSPRNLVKAVVTE